MCNVGVGARRGRTEAHSAYSSHASPLSSSTRLRYSSSPHGGGRVFRSSASSAFAAASSSTVDRELSQAAQISSQFRTARTRERAQLEELNDRFAGFVDRVHELELQNRSLEAELDALRRRHHAQPHRLGALYEQEARALRAAVEQVQAERQEALGRRESLEQALGDLEGRRREEELGRQETEVRLLELRGEADRAALARAEAEKRTEALLDELTFLKKIHEEEVSELQAQAQLQARVQAEIEGEAAGAAVPDLSGALRDIRAQYEGLAAKNARSAEEWFRGKVGTLSESVAQHSHAVRTSKDEAGEVRGQLQSRLLDIDACRGVNCSLEKQLVDVEERQAAEVAVLQVRGGPGRRDGGGAGLHQAGDEWLPEGLPGLLNIKMALDIEIAAYRKLLEGEESRFSRVGTVGGASSSMQYRSHSVSVAAPPSFSRPLFAPGPRSGGSYLATSRVHLGSTFIASRSHKVQATPQPEEEEEKEKEKEEEVEVKEKVEGGDEDKEEDKEEEEKEEGGEGGDEEEEKPEMTEDTKEGAERQEETKETEKEEEVVTEDKEATEQVVEKEVSDDSGKSGGVKQAGKEDKDKGEKKIGEEEKKEVGKAKVEEKKKTEQEDEVKPEMKGEKEGGKEGGKEKQESEQPREESKKEEAATEKAKK
ncbi:hypothetical protein CRUP_015554 [Coryphaenoides rupestris]|nr:hypothetical protein CRUP_015554 [Coryphaenoides rupestris]